MDNFIPLKHASDDVNRAAFLIDVIDHLRQCETFVNCTLSCGILGFHVPLLRVRILTSLISLASLQVDFGLFTIDPFYLQAPHNHLVLEVQKRISDLRVSLTQLLGQLDSQNSNQVS